MNGVSLPCRSFEAGPRASWIPTNRAKSLSSLRRSGLLGSFSKRGGSCRASFASHSSDSTASDQLSKLPEKSPGSRDDKGQIEADFCHASFKDADEHTCSTNECTRDGLEFACPESPASSSGSHGSSPAENAAAPPALSDGPQEPPSSPVDLQTNIPQLSKSDFLVGRFLGKGSFSDVFEVMVVTADEEDPPPLESLDDSLKKLSELIHTKFPGIMSSAAGEGKDRVDAEGGGAKFGGKKVKGGCDADENIEDISGSAAHRDLEQVCSEENIEQGKNCISEEEADHQQIRASSQSGKSKRRQTVDLGQPFCQKGRSQKQTRTLAMKCLRPQIRSDAENFLFGLEDLVHETSMLSSLSHPHIIKIRGRAAGDVPSASRPNDGYFILLDRLTDTLEDRIASWRKTMDRRAAPAPSQIKTATCIADAMSYLHSRNIVFRDLKPANVGFDAMGVPKLFDFGFSMATEARGSPLYEICGTPRYMAPEVGRARGYGASADVYSFGILLWEMCALRKPFDKFKSGSELRRAILGGSRPKPARSWPTVLRELMGRCWSGVPSDRPGMESAKAVLAAHVRELSAKQDGGKAGLRRSFQLRRFSD